MTVATSSRRLTRRLRRLRLFGPTVIYSCARARPTRAQKGKRKKR